MIRAFKAHDEDRFRLSIRGQTYDYSGTVLRALYTMLAGRVPPPGIVPILVGGSYGFPEDVTDASPVAGTPDGGTPYLLPSTIQRLRDFTFPDDADPKAPGIPSPEPVAAGSPASPQVSAEGDIHLATVEIVCPHH